MDWALRYGWKDRRRVKPALGIFKGADDERPSAELLISSCMRAGTTGLLLYYAEGCWDAPELPRGISTAFGPGGIALR